MTNWPWPKVQSEGAGEETVLKEMLELIEEVDTRMTSDSLAVIATRSDGAKLRLTDEVDLFGYRLAEVQLQDGRVLPQRMIPQAFLKFGGWDEVV